MRNHLISQGMDKVDGVSIVPFSLGKQELIVLAFLLSNILYYFDTILRRNTRYLRRNTK